jgi:tyrosinase
MPASERIAYIAAVECVTKQNTTYSRAEVPGARSHFDDFVATHINYTWSIHDSGT